MSLLSVVTGKKVLFVKIIFDYFQILFDDNIRLSVLNKYYLLPESANVSDLCEKVVESIDEEDTSIRLTFSGNLSLQIDMSDSGYIGPEALILIRPELPTVVWN